MRRSQFKPQKQAAYTRSLSVYVVVAFVVFTIAVFAFLVADRFNRSMQSNQTVNSFEECVVSRGKKLIDTYPKQCKHRDGKTFIEQVFAPIDTNGWERVQSSNGLSFKCPPSWNCSIDDEGTASFGESHYKRTLVTIQLVSLDNFAESSIRHSSYNSPRAWFAALEKENQQALTTRDADIRNVWGTDGKEYPIYHQLNYNDVRVEDISFGRAVIFDTQRYMFVAPKESQDVLVIQFNADSAFQDPIVNAVIDSVEVSEFATSAESFTARFEIRTFGTKRVFTSSMYHNQSSDVFIEKTDPQLVHVKKPGVTWANFFETLPFSLTSECLVTGTNQTFCNSDSGRLYFSINGEETSDALDKPIALDDVLIVEYR